MSSYLAADFVLVVRGTEARILQILYGVMSYTQHHIGGVAFGGQISNHTWRRNHSLRFPFAPATATLTTSGFPTSFTCSTWN
ncbi:hypothetical protein COMA2_10378 [Candidatus Nitrospira nitrificans]|uniref:Uncharacterized protein n=1 Tax=Candidatus Nitrospira nitrificans TaxID=1742973 RepID=A0A0S4L7U4_9BACT|nr:hypothetical protein COMA2_10378 [Candidatus Nitrospira nitrificans]